MENPIAFNTCWKLRAVVRITDIKGKSKGKAVP